MLLLFFIIENCAFFISNTFISNTRIFENIFVISSVSVQKNIFSLLVILTRFKKTPAKHHLSLDFGKQLGKHQQLKFSNPYQKECVVVDDKCGGPGNVCNTSAHPQLQHLWRHCDAIGIFRRWPIQKFLKISILVHRTENVTFLESLFRIKHPRWHRHTATLTHSNLDKDTKKEKLRDPKTRRYRDTQTLRHLPTQTMAYSYYIHS